MHGRPVQAEAFAHYCRTGEGEVPGVALDRLQLYRERIFKGIDGHLRRAFPLAERDLGEEAWHTLVSDFMREHTIRAPQVWKIGLELVNYVRDADYGARLDRPYFNDLLWFEWVEIAVHMMPDEKVEVRDLTLNPAHDLCHLRYPVFRQFGRELAQKKGDYFLLTYRHPGTLNVHFVELSPLLALAIEELRGGPCTREELHLKIGLPISRELCDKMDEFTKQGVLLS